MPRRRLQAHTRLAAERGATLIIGERVVSWRALGQGSVASSSAPPAAAGASATAAGGVEVVTDAGRRLTADALVLAAGPWMGQLVPELRSLAVPERQVVAWFQVADEARRRHKFRPESFPVFIVMVRPRPSWCCCMRVLYTHTSGAPASMRALLPLLLLLCLVTVVLG